jgi:hypothetical protein
MTLFRSLDLNNTDVICQLMALDTDLREFYYLCLEQGPFFKLIFDEFVTDAHTKRLQQAPAGLPACRPHVSHFGRDYWRPQIEKSQILEIRNTTNLLHIFIRLDNELRTAIFKDKQSCIEGIDRSKTGPKTNLDH